jgi:hypothetical protein
MVHEYEERDDVLTITVAGGVPLVRRPEALAHNHGDD